MSPYEYTPKPWKWSDLDGEQVTVRVIRSEGLEQVYLFHKDAIYLVSETTESVERPCPECSTDEMDVTHIKPRRNVFDEVSETTRNAEQLSEEAIEKIRTQQLRDFGHLDAKTQDGVQDEDA